MENRYDNNENVLAKLCIADTWYGYEKEEMINNVEKLWDETRFE